MTHPVHKTEDDHEWIGVHILGDQKYLEICRCGARRYHWYGENVWHYEEPKQ